jgi:hypothetical protein
MTALQKTIITATIIAAACSGIYEARQASTLRSQVQELQQQQAPLTEQLSKLKTDNERFSKLVAQPRDSHALAQAQLNELLKLRAKSTAAQADSRELAKLKSTLAQPTGKLPDFLYKSMLAGADNANQKAALARLSRMKQILNLTDDQEQAIRSILTNNIPRQSKLAVDLMTGKAAPEQAQALARAKSDQEAQVKALLTPEQLAAYPEYQQAEKTAAADTSATSAAGEIARKFSLPKDQQEQLRARFYEMELKESAGGPSQQAIAEASQSGKVAEAVNMSVELKKAQLEQKMKILEAFLSPEQMAAYRQEQTDQINNAMKMFAPQKPAEATN